MITDRGAALRRQAGVALAILSAMVVGLAFAGPASGAQISTYVGCSDLEEATPSHECEVGDFPGAFFEADEETEYDICIEFPNESSLCAEEQFAEANVLYVNSIITSQVGRHYVDWYISGTEDLIGSWAFDLKEAPKPLPPPVLPTPPAAIAPPTVPGPSKACLSAKKRVKTLAGRLGTAGKKQKATIRGKLKKSRSSVKKLC